MPMITSSGIQTCPYYNSLEYKALLASFPKDFGKLYKFSYVAYIPPARHCATRRDVYDYLAPEIKAMLSENEKESGVEQLRTRLSKCKSSYSQSMNRIKPKITFLSDYFRESP